MKQKNVNVGSKLGANSKDHWQVNVNLTPEGADNALDAWNPRKSKNRPCTHVKTNECDH